MDDDEDGQWRYLGYPLTCALFDGNVRLKEGTDYTAVYTDNLNAGGTATATFVGKGNYTGTKVEWDKMQIGSGNDTLTKAERSYNCEI
jgi:hypothetical protein